MRPQLGKDQVLRQNLLDHFRGQHAGELGVQPLVLGRKTGAATNFRFSNPFKNQRLVDRKLAGCPLFSRPRTSATGC